MLKNLRILLLFLSAFGFAQPDSIAEIHYDTSPITVREINNEDLRAFRDNPDFDYEEAVQEQNWWYNFKIWLGNLLSEFFEWLFGVEKAASFLQVFFQIIPYVLLLILVFILIKFFLNVNANALRQAKKNEALVALSEEEHIIKNEDIQQLVQEALRNKNYRLAVRYYYLLMLQLMSDKKIIVWEIQKTNDDYFKEIENQQLKKPFSAITQWYDYIWYGGFDLDEVKYKRAETDFIELQNCLKHA